MGGQLQEAKFLVLELVHKLDLVIRQEKEMWFEPCLEQLGSMLDRSLSSKDTKRGTD